MKIYKIASKTDTISKKIAKAIMHVANNLESPESKFSFWLLDIFYDAPELFCKDDGDMKIEKIIVKVIDSSRAQTHVTAVVHESSPQVGMNGMYDSTGFILVTFEKGGLSNGRKGLHPSEMESAYMRVFNVVRHEIEHTFQGNKHLTYNVGGMFADDKNGLKEKAKKHLFDGHEKESRAMGGYLQSKQQRSSLRDVYRNEIKTMINNMTQRFEFSEEEIQGFYNNVENIVEDQVSIIEKRIGHSLTGFMV